MAVWQIAFRDLADYLMHGREIEFRYKDKDYSITNSHHEWHFCCDTDGTTVALCAFSELDILVDKVRSLEIDGVRIEQIFNESLGRLDVIDVL